MSPGVARQLRVLAAKAAALPGTEAQAWAQELRSIANQLDSSLERLTHLMGRAHHDLRVIEGIVAPEDPGDVNPPH